MGAVFCIVGATDDTKNTNGTSIPVYNFYYDNSGRLRMKQVHETHDVGCSCSKCSSNGGFE